VGEGRGDGRTSKGRRQGEGRGTGRRLRYQQRHNVYTLSENAPRAEGKATGCSHGEIRGYRSRPSMICTTPSTLVSEPQCEAPRSETTRSTVISDSLPRLLIPSLLPPAFPPLPHNFLEHCSQHPPHLPPRTLTSAPPASCFSQSSYCTNPPGPYR